MSVPPPPACVELSFRPSAEALPLVNDFVEAFCGHASVDPAWASKLVIAARELLENAVKFSKDGVSEVRVEISRAPGGAGTSIRTKNRSGRDDIAVLERTIDEIAAAPDPFAHYVALMHRSVARGAGSGLGLGRIRAETDLSLRAEIVDDVVTVYAEAKGGLEEGAGMDLQVAAIVVDKLKVQASIEAGTLVVHFAGSADMRTMSALASFVAQVHPEARRLGKPEVVVDLRKLEFMSSSCFKVVITWITQILALPPAERYKLRFLASRLKMWQERSLAALQAFAPDQIVVEVLDGEPPSSRSRA
jgi:anti-anti-sigma factor